MATKIIAFDIATLSSLSQSMYEDVSTILALRLRGNANSLDRSGERSRRALEAASHTAPAGAAEDSLDSQIARAEQTLRDAPAAQPAEAEPQVPPAPPAAEPAPAAPEVAMAAVAEALATDLETIPPGQMWGEMARIMTLTSQAAEIVTAPPPAPALPRRKPPASADRLHTRPASTTLRLPPAGQRKRTWTSRPRRSDA